jgi:hypothetical protein
VVEVLEVDVLEDDQMGWPEDYYSEMDIIKVFFFKFFQTFLWDLRVLII